jgi:hypothetical protein
VGADLGFAAVPGIEYILQVTGDAPTESGLYALELSSSETFTSTKVTST